MRHKLGQNAKADKGSSSVPWLLGGAVAGVGLYFLGKELFKPKAPASGPGQTLVMPVPTVAPPERFANFASVDARFSQLRDLYNMGYKKPPEALAEVEALKTATNQFAARGQVDQAIANRMIEDLDAFKARILDTIQFFESLKTQPPAIGRRYR